MSTYTKGINNTFINKVVKPKNAELNVRAFPTTAATNNGINTIMFTAKAGSPIGRSSGEYYITNGAKWYVVNLYKSYNVGGKQQSFGFVREDVVSFYEPVDNSVAEKNAQSMMDSLVANDKKLYAQILKLNYLIKTAKSKKKNVAAIETRFKALVKAYEARQNLLKTNTLLKVQAWSDDTLKKIKSYFGIGVEPVTLTAVGYALIGALVLAQAYLLFKPHYETGIVNLKESAELEKALATLTPEEAQKVKTDLEKQIDDAYTQGKTDESTSSFFGSFKNILLIGGGALAVMYIAKNK